MTTTGNGFINNGTDHSIIITSNDTKQVVALDGRRTMFRAKAKDSVQSGTAVDQGGLVDHRVQPGGWAGSIECDRNNSQFSQLIAAIEAAKYAGGKEAFFTITSYEEDADHSEVAIFQYTRVVFHDYDPGSWAKDVVKASVSFEAQERKFQGLV